MTRRDTKNLWVVASALAATLCVLTTVRASAGPYDWAAGLPGCHPEQPAVAHHAGQQVLVSQPTNGPVPCGVLTGEATVENRIEVTNAGTVIYMPALLPGQPPQVAPGVDPDLALLGGCGHVPGSCIGQTVSRSFDEGATWGTSTAVAFPDPTGEGFAVGDVDNNLYVDHGTGRLFYYDYDSGNVGVQPHLCGNGEGATIFFSDDNATTWSHGFDFDKNCTENPTILVGKPRISSPTGYPNVVYLCGNNFGTGIGGIGSTGKACSKSLDGGATWLGDAFENGTILPGDGGQGCYSGACKDDLNPYPQCANGARSSGGNGVQPLPDGTLRIVVSCGGNTYLSESRDEGRTWNITNEIPSGGELRADSAGNLYKLRQSGLSLLLSTSTDGGVTWSAEKDMIAPGVVSRGTTFFAQGTHRVGHEPGRVAVMYYGIRAGKTTSDGFITETRNALDPNPVFWSGQVNSPDQGPLLYENEPFSNIGITVLDFIGGAFSPDGRSVWASYVQDCGENMFTSPKCTSRWTLEGINPGNPQDGFAGRLVWRTALASHE